VAWLEDVSREKNRPVVAKLPIAQRVRLRQMTLGVPSFAEDGTIGFAPDCQSPKLDKLIEIHERVSEPIVAATSSQKFAAEAVRRLNARGIRSFEWSSKASDRARDAALADFEAGRYDIIVGVTEAIGTGIDGLQQASGVLVSLERSQDLASEVQLEGRLDRRGQRREDGVLHYEIVAEDSMDLGIISRQLKRRLDLNRSLRAKQRGF
jgi:superfamily II DNA/RNA helicase